MGQYTGCIGLAVVPMSSSRESVLLCSPCLLSDSQLRCCSSSTRYVVCFGDGPQPYRETWYGISVEALIKTNIKISRRPQNSAGQIRGSHCRSAGSPSYKVVRVCSYMASLSLVLRQHALGQGIGIKCERQTTYLLFATRSSLSLPSPASFLFLGCGLCTKVQSWLWNWQSTHAVAPSCITHLLLRRRHASHGLSFLLLVFLASPAAFAAAPSPAVLW